jgi:excisionase family DNA binding protein
LLFSDYGNKVSGRLAKCKRFPTEQRGRMSLLTINELTRELRVSRSSLYRLLARGDGPRTMKIGGQVRIPAEDVEEWLGRLKSAGAAREKAAA